MKKILYIFFLFISKLSFVFGQDKNAGIFKNSGVSSKDLRQGNINLDDIPNMISSFSGFLIGISWTIAIIFIIIGSYQMIFGRIAGDNTSGKKTIIAAIVGGIIASLALVIVKFIVDNLSI